MKIFITLRFSIFVERENSAQWQKKTFNKLYTYNNGGLFWLPKVEGVNKIIVYANLTWHVIQLGEQNVDLHGQDNWTPSQNDRNAAKHQIWTFGTKTPQKIGAIL